MSIADIGLAGLGDRSVRSVALSRKRALLVLAIAIVLASASAIGCGAGEERSETAAPAEPAERDQTGPADGERAGPTEMEMVAVMEAHYTSTILAHDALVQGDLAAFRAQLAETAAHELPASAPAAWRPFDRQLHDASLAAAAATSLSDAAATMASVALACGACHQGVDAGPVYPAPAPRDAGDPLHEAMQGHEWATERLWEGVTGPWGNAWERGAAALAQTRIFAGGEPIPAPDDSLQRREAALRALGEEARATTGLDARARLYGRLLATCGDCHQALGVKLPRYEDYK